MNQRVQALMLAAGNSRRFGSDKRLHALEDGTPMLAQSLRNLQRAVQSAVLVVRPGETPFFAELLASNTSLKIVEAAHASAGMGASLACGIRHIDGDAVLVALADMPVIQAATIVQVAAALRRHPVVVPEYRGKPGHPVGFHRRFFAELAELKADEGGKNILQRHRDVVKRLVVCDPGVIKDIDTPRELIHCTCSLTLP